MADTKISALTPITPVVGTMKLPVATVGLANGSITPTGILAYGTDPITGTTITASTSLNLTTASGNGVITITPGEDAISRLNLTTNSGTYGGGSVQIYTDGTKPGYLFLSTNLSPRMMFDDGNKIQLPANNVFGFTSVGDASLTLDTGISRGGAGNIKIGNGTAGNASGSVTAATITATTRLVGAKVSESVTAGAGWTITAGTAASAVSALSLTQARNYSAAATDYISGVFTTTGGGTATNASDNLLNFKTGASGAEASVFSVNLLGGLTLLSGSSQIVLSGDGSGMFPTINGSAIGPGFLNGAAGLIKMPSSHTIGFISTSASTYGQSLDTGISRISAGIIGIGTGTAGSFAGGLKLTDLTINRAATFLTTSVALTNGAGASAGTLTNAPAVGNPTKWIGIDDNGTTRYIPAW